MKVMKVSAIALALLYLFLNPGILHATNYGDVENNVVVNSSSGNGGNSNSTVNITNDLNTDSNQSGTTKTSTSIQMNQSGNGHSKVSINGKTYELNGAGNISVNENSDDTNLTPTQTPTPEPSKTPDVKGIKSFLSPFDIMRQLFSNIRSFFKNLF